MSTEVGARVRDQPRSELFQRRRQRSVLAHAVGGDNGTEEVFAERADAEPAVLFPHFGRNRGDLLGRSRQANFSEQPLRLSGFARKLDAERLTNEAPPSVAGHKPATALPRTVGQLHGHAITILVEAHDLAPARHLRSQLGGALGQ